MAYSESDTRANLIDPKLEQSQFEEKQYFIKRKFETQNIQEKQTVEFENILVNNISVILGEQYRN
ncbi:hypothetical protein [Aliarcobacter skirrowii]|jgi:hypothetical protein|uniref:hypothetical protein n=1 Tax=Aliarcobacter skirrowii TaxID=28200 RepID=UPI00082473D8|nr:hypothetical protein [Aliarcobacter skirrowii]AZL53863.1 hypothetical protein EI285_04440 [Aliarcobacter skirrowii]MDX4051022.1 hypothetical protein [Aliarcobacter skirrowii]